MRKNKGDKFFIVNDDCTLEEVEAIIRFAITIPPPRMEYILYTKTKREFIGKDDSGKNLIMTYISRIEHKNGVQTLTSISDEEYARCQQVIKEIIESNMEENDNERS